MADLVPGDLVLGRDGATSILAVQHKAVDAVAEMLTFLTADGASVSVTPDHALFVDGVLVAAAEAKVGSTLTNSKGAATVIKRIAKRKSTVINPVTADGTIVADGVLAACNPYWIASLTIDAPLKRTIVNLAIYAAGNVDTLAAGLIRVLGRLVLLALLLLAVIALGITCKASKVA